MAQGRFLRWGVRSQGRSPHASGKAKNTFGSFGIPLFGAPQAPDNNSPWSGYKPGGMAPWGRRKSPVQNCPEVARPTECNPRTGEERPHTNALELPPASHGTWLWLLLRDNHKLTGQPIYLIFNLYIYMCVCVCVWVKSLFALSFKLQWKQPSIQILKPSCCTVWSYLSTSFFFIRLWYQFLTWEMNIFIAEASTTTWLLRCHNNREWIMNKSK